MYRNILVAYDGSDHAEKAMDAALELAGKFGAELHLVQVIDHAHASRGTAEFAKAEHAGDPDVVEVEVAKRNLMEKVQKRAQDAGIKALSANVARGDAAEELLAYAKGCGADMMVMGRRGIGRVEGLLVGSVSSKVNSLAGCAVLTVK
jgi:nucleotide-binding universal stress UspA family protein